MPDAAEAMVRLGCDEAADRVAGLFDGTAAGAADIAHLWSHPVLLDGARYRAIAGEVPCTPVAEAVEQTLE